MSVYKRGATYWMDFRVGGKRHRESTKRTTKKAALLVEAAARQRLLDRAQLGVDQDWTLGHAIDQWTALKAPSLRSGTDQGHTLKRLIGLGENPSRLSQDPFCWSPDMNMEEITQGALTTLRDHRVLEGHSPASINREMAAIRSLYQFCLDRDVMVAPVRKWPRERETRKERYLTPEEETRVLEVLPEGSEERCMFSLLMDTGLRRGEAAILTWGDIDLSASSLRVYRPKTDSWSWVPLTPRVVRELTGLGRGLPRAPLWSVTGDVLVKHLNRTFRDLSLDGVTAHTLRHTFASRLAQAGLSLQKIASLLGHTSTQMSERYAHLQPGEVAEEARQLLANMAGEHRSTL